jgi:splicing factor 3A subunit 1
MSLNLPKPVNTYAGQDELRNTNGNGHSTGNGEDEAEYRAPRMSDRFKATMIYPPKEMRSESISLLSLDHFFASHLWSTT